MVHVNASTRRELASETEKTRGKWRRPYSFTAIIDIVGEDFEALHKRLRALEEDFLVALKSVGDVHTFRLSAIPRNSAAVGTACLVLNTVHDRPPAEHLKQLVNQVGDLLRQILRNSDQPLSNNQLVKYLMRHRVFEDTFFLGCVNKTVEQILNEDELRHSVRAWIAKQVDSGNWNNNTNSEDILRDVRSHVSNQQDFPIWEAAEPVKFFPKLLKWIDQSRIFILFPAIGILAATIERSIDSTSSVSLRTWRWVLYLFWRAVSFVHIGGAKLLAGALERIEPAEMTLLPFPERVAQLEEREDRQSKNAVTIVFNVKKSWIRRLSLKLILIGAEFGCRHFWNKGKLEGIPTLHYARLIRINQGRQLLFMSDFDGGLNRYLDDFLSVGKVAVLSFTSNLVGCPKTKGLFSMDSAAVFGPRWKLMIRANQLPTAVLFNAYPELTVKEILGNSAFREELFAENPTDSQIRSWLRRI